MTRATGFGHVGTRIGNSMNVDSCTVELQASTTRRFQRRTESISGPLVAGPTITLGCLSLAYRIPPNRGEHGGILNFQRSSYWGRSLTLPFMLVRKASPSFNGRSERALPIYQLLLLPSLLLFSLGWGLCEQEEQSAYSSSHHSEIARCTSTGDHLA